VHTSVASLSPCWIQKLAWDRAKRDNFGKLCSMPAGIHSKLDLTECLNKCAENDAWMPPQKLMMSAFVLLKPAAVTDK